MNKEQAELYVTKSLKQIVTTSKGFHFKILLLNIICLVIGIAFYHNLNFIIFTTIIILINIMSTIFLTQNFSKIIKVNVLIFIQLLVFGIALNCLIFSINHFAKNFILWEFIISIIFQIVSWFMGFFLVKTHAEKFVPNEKLPKIEILAGSAAGFTCVLTSVLCRIFSPSLSAIVTPFIILVNLMICLLGVGVTSAVYKIYLIKKYNISLE